MRVNSQDIISKETQASSRNILTASSSVLVVQLFNYNSMDWDILGRKVAPSEFAIIASVLVAFLLINHLIKWSSDNYLYKKWFSLNHVPAGSLEQIGRIEATLGPIEGLSERLNFLCGDLEKIVAQEAKGRRPTEMAEHLLAENLDKALKEIRTLKELVDSALGSQKEANKLLSQLDKRFSSVSLTVKFIVFGWYLALPIAVGLAAFLSLICGKFL